MTALQVGCLTSRTISTGVTLPQSEATITSPSLTLTINHDCSNGWCKGFDVKVQNLMDEPLSLLVSQSEITRADETQRLSTKDGDGRTLTVGPKATETFFLFPVGDDGRTRVQYFRATGVWCSLRADSSCTNTTSGEEECAGFARYYYQSYKDAGGWIGVRLKLMAKSWEGPEMFATEAPGVMPPPPPTKLSTDADAPVWLFGSGANILHRVTCDDRCFCEGKEPKVSFQKDHAFKPLDE